MTNPATTYQPLGNFIRKVDNRNRDLKVKNLVGLTIEKAFIPSVANIIGTDLSNYKVIRKRQFACSLMQVSRDGKMPIAMFAEEEGIMSPAYPMFEVADEKVLLPEYLMMWFARSEFDREASYYAVGGVRGSLEWDDFCAMRIPVPPIAEQRAIVAEYAAVQHRMEVNKRLIAKLEETAQTLYKKMFVEGVDKKNLPDGWRMGTLGEVCEINPKLSVLKNVEIPYIDMDGLSTNGFSFNKIQNRIFTSGMKFQNDDVLFARISPCMENGKAAIVSGLKKNEIAYGSTEFIVLRGKQQKLTAILATLVRQDEFRSFAKKQMKGSDGRQRVEANSLYNFELTLPSSEILQDIELTFEVIINLSLCLSIENTKLTELQSLLLARMGI